MLQKDADITHPRKIYNRVIDDIAEDGPNIDDDNSILMLSNNLIALQALNLMPGEQITIMAQGENGSQAIDYFVELLKNNLSSSQRESRDIQLGEAFDNIIGKSEKLFSALGIAMKASETSSTVILHGESGTGKELVARAIHDASSRRNGPFIKVNCPAIPSTLLESELFGHERGAFTGALYQKIGKFELANGGTIFLDEIGELDNNMQAKLLRVLQDREIERVGGNTTIDIDVRIISATHRNLKKMIKEGQFREDLYYRLNVVPVSLPSLRERREDIPLLVEHFTEKLCKKLDKDRKVFSKRALRLLCNYDWPGNVRELENIVERMINLTSGQIIDVGDLPQNISNLVTKKTHSLINFKRNGKLATFKEYEKAIIEAGLNMFGSFNATGKALGLTHKTVAAKARKYGLVE